jgi:4-amino-4-deoxy-L-arabinose transferase-like glycosyltransferase
MPEAKTNWALGCLLIVLIIATVFRIYHLAEIPPGLYPDEAMNGNNALEALRTGNYKLYYPENNGREGLFINIQALFLKAVGINEPWVLRLPSAIFGILTVWGIYFLGRELFSKPVGLAAAFLLATSFWHINFSRIGFRAIMAPLFLVWGLYFLLIALRKGTTMGKGRFKDIPLAARVGYSAAFGGGILFGLGFHTYIAYRIMVLLLPVIWYFFRKRNGFGKVGGAFLAGAFIAGLPIGLYYLQNPGDFFGRTAQISVFSEKNPLLQLGINIFKTIGMFFWAGDYNPRHNLSGEPQLFLPVAILFLVGIFVGVREISKNSNAETQMPNQVQSLRFKNLDFVWQSEVGRRVGFWILFVWLGLAALPVVISSEGLPHALRSILMLPPVILLAAAGGVYLYKKLTAARKGRFAAWSTGILALIIFTQAYVAYFLVWAKNPHTADAFSADYVALGRELNSLPREIPKYVIVQAGGVEVRGIPMPAQTVMFITDTFSPENQKAKNIYYLLPAEEKNLPPEGLRFYLK